MVLRPTVIEVELSLAMILPVAEAFAWWIVVKASAEARPRVASAEQGEGMRRSRRIGRVVGRPRDGASPPMRDLRRRELGNSLLE